MHTRLAGLYLGQQDRAPPDYYPLIYLVRAPPQINERSQKAEGRDKSPYKSGLAKPQGHGKLRGGVHTRFAIEIEKSAGFVDPTDSGVFRDQICTT